LFKPYRLALASLCIYRNILRDPLLQSLLQLLEQGIKEADSISTRDAYYEFLYQLFQSGMSFKNYLIDLIRYDDNPFSRACELSDIDNIDQVLLAAARQDLRNLHFLYKLDFRSLEERLGIRETALDLAHYAPNSLAVKLDEAKDWVSQIEILAEYHQTHSRGIIARYKAFSFSSPLGLQGIEKPDLPAMDDLIGCSRQKELLCHNTENFLKGHPANNVLLYGPRGTGKSTMIRALLSKYGDQALRLIQLDREHIDCLPELMALLAGYNVRFIIFIDDLSFEEHETKYKALKAVLEGGLVCQPSNVLIYATSNRRHLVREFFSDRGKMGEEVHGMDTLQEKLSLADRFGLCISFETPDKKTYLQIVDHLAQKNRLQLDTEQLHQQALQWERGRHGPSGRTARQFIDSLDRD
jgi:predicted AAA+ superfamily ATPase